ncbi:hypothetical protein HFN87_35565 [Rhizobium laguerreae]|nr:hypothetical protein [Rhizobium laguerreae]
MAGLACIKRSGELFPYEEQGKLRLATGQQFAFSRSYYFVSEGGDLLSYFDPGRSQPFLHFHMRESTGEHSGKAVHYCGDDTYQATFRFERGVSFATEYVIKGPQKDLVLSTTYVRDSGIVDDAPRPELSVGFHADNTIP